MKKIIDEFSGMECSNEWKRKLRKLREGRCTLSTCDQALKTKNHCLEHAIQFRENQRKKMGCKRRNNSMTYRLEKKEKSDEDLGIIT